MDLSKYKLNYKFESENTINKEYTFINTTNLSTTPCQSKKSIKYTDYKKNNLLPKSTAWTGAKRTDSLTDSKSYDLSTYLAKSKREFRNSF